MKTMLLIVALIGFTAINGYAQNKSCCYKHKMVYKKAPATTDNTEHTIVLYAPVKEKEPCVTFKKDNIVVTECPAVYDNSGTVEFNLEGTYMGNYPLVCTPVKAADGSYALDCVPK